MVFPNKFLSFFVAIGFALGLSAGTQAAGLAKANTGGVVSIPPSASLAVLSAQEIRALPREKQIGYLKSLRSVLSAAEAVQNTKTSADYASDLSAKESFRYVYNLLFQNALIGEALAETESECKSKDKEAKKTKNSCLVAGNVGKYQDHRCKLSSEKKCTPSGGVSDSGRECNPELYPLDTDPTNKRGACISFSTANDKKYATKTCGDNSKIDILLQRINGGPTVGLATEDSSNKFNAELARIQETADSINDACMNVSYKFDKVSKECKFTKTKKEGKGITQDRKDTCKAFQERLTEINGLVCKNSGDKKMSEKLTTFCLVTAKPPDKVVDDDKSKCAAAIANLDSITKAADQKCSEAKIEADTAKPNKCAEQVRTCRTGITDKCNTIQSDHAQTLAQIETKLKSNDRDYKEKFADFMDAIGINTSFNAKGVQTKTISPFESDCIGNIKSRRTGEKDEQWAKRILDKQHWDTFKRQMPQIYSKTRPNTSSCRGSDNQINECKRAFWKTYLNEIAADNNQRIDDMLAAIDSCNALTPEQKQKAIDNLRAMQHINNNLDDEFRTNTELVKKVDGAPGIADLNFTFTDSTESIDKWIKGLKIEPSMAMCCQLKDATDVTGSRWCSKDKKINPSFNYTVQKAKSENKSYEQSIKSKGDDAAR